jgi:putative acyl-CoA dehydrogenase
MQNVLADLCVESEAATVLAMRLARSYDDRDHPFRRLATAVAKYWVCKVTPAHVGEALECLGGNGYVEESGMPRLFRESPLNSIWEGAGNVNCLDVLRVLAKEEGALAAYFAEVALASDPRLDRAIAELQRQLEEQRAASARRLVEQLALVLQGSLLVRHGDPEVAEAFLASRLAGDGGRAYGTLPAGIDFARIIERHRPKL